MKAILKAFDRFGYFVGVLRNPDVRNRLMFWIQQYTVNNGIETIVGNDGSSHAMKFGPWTVEVYYEDSYRSEWMFGAQLIDYIAINGKKMEQFDCSVTPFTWRTWFHCEKSTVTELPFINLHEIKESIDVRIPAWLCKIAKEYYSRRGYIGGWNYPAPYYKPVAQEIHYSEVNL